MFREYLKIPKCKVTKYGHDNLNQKKCKQNYSEEGENPFVSLKTSNVVVTHLNMGMQPQNWYSF